MSLVDGIFLVSIGVILGYFIGVLRVFYIIRKLWPDLYAELRKRVFEEDDDDGGAEG